MTLDFLDIPTIIYLGCGAVGLYGFSLFAWWWKRIGSATEIYAYITFLFLGILISSLVGVYSRYLHVISEPRYHTFVNSFWWGVGPTIILIILLAICARMTRRVFIIRYGTRMQVNRELRLMTCPHCGEPCPRWGDEEERNRGRRKENNNG